MSELIPSLRFRELLYRFMFYGWLFKDASQGNMWERSSAWRHNCEQAKWLPTYIRRSVCCAAIFLLIAISVEMVLLSPVLSAFFYVPLILMAPYSVITTIAWLYFLKFS